MDRTSRTVIAALFLLSGACTLVYQVVWVRMLVVVFGTSVFALSTVLTSFMAGLALGAALFGRLVDRRRDPLRLYALLELAIAAFALVFPLLLARLDLLYTALYRAFEGHAGLFDAARFLLAFLLLLVPTTLMGATLPVLAKFVVRQPDAVGRGIGRLYAWNTLGAAAGAFASAYVLIELLGTHGATWIAAAVNLLVAVSALGLGLRSQPAGRPSDRSRAAVAPKRDLPDSPAPALARLVFWGYALSGFTALAYEVIWTRSLSVILRLTTTQSLAAILVVFLTGLALGSAVGARSSDRLRNPVADFGRLQLALGACGLLSIFALAAAPRIKSLFGPAFSWTGHIVQLFATVALILGIPTFLMGLLFPVAGRIHARGLDSLGRRIGNVYAINTAGSILGAFAGGYLLIPILGSQPSLLLLAWLNLGLGLVVLLLAARPARARLATLGAATAGALIVGAILPRDALVEGFRMPGTELLYYQEGAGGTVTVHSMQHDTMRLLKVNGAGEVPTDPVSIQTFRLLGNLPMLLHPDPREVLVIAFGGGVTLGAVARHRPERLDCVEVVRGVVEASRHLADYNDRVFERVGREGLELIVEDGRNHVLRTSRSYDVIISDSTHPATADSWVLYTREFYELSRNRLREGGLFAQWLPLHGLSEDDYKMILRTFRTAFPHATLWLTRGYSVMLGTPGPLELNYVRLGSKLARPALLETLTPVELEDPLSFLATLALDEPAFAEYVGEGPINSDAHPYIGFRDRARTGTQTGIPAMASLLPWLTRPLSEGTLQASPKYREALARRRLARAHSLAAWLHLGLGQRRRAEQELRRAWELDPLERDLQNALRELAGQRERDRVDSPVPSR